MSLRTPYDPRWYDYILLQMVAEAYLDGIDLRDPADVRKALLAGNNDLRSTVTVDGVPDQPNQMLPLYGLLDVNGTLKPNAEQTAILPGATRFTNLQVEYLLNKWEIKDYVANDAGGFSATLLRDKTTGEYTLAFRSTEYSPQARGGDRERDIGNGSALVSPPAADAQIATTGFAYAQIDAAERYFQRIKTEFLAREPGALTVLGYSLGGHMALALTETHYDDIEQTILINAAGRGVVENAAIADPFAHPTAILRTMFNSLLANPGAYKTDPAFTAEARVRIDAYARSALSPAFFLPRTGLPGLDRVLRWEPGFVLYNRARSEPGDPWARTDQNIYKSARYQWASAALSLFTRGAAGVEILGEGWSTSSAIYDPANKITSLFGNGAHNDDSWTAQAGRTATAQRNWIFVEDQPDGYSGVTSGANLDALQPYRDFDFARTHSITLIADSLALTNAFVRLDPTLIGTSEDQFRIDALLAAASNARSTNSGILSAAAGALKLPIVNPAFEKTAVEADSLENALDAVWKILKDDTRSPSQPDPVGFGNLENREKYYERLSLLNAITVGSGEYRIDPLVNVTWENNTPAWRQAMPGVPVPTSYRTVFGGAAVGVDEIAARAKGNDPAAYAYRYALLELNPFVLIGAKYQEDTRLNAGGRLDYVTNPGTTAEAIQYSDEFLRDRAQFLVYKAQRNIDDAGFAASADGGTWLYEDVGSAGFTVAVAPIGSQLARVLAGAEALDNAARASKVIERMRFALKAGDAARVAFGTADADAIDGSAQGDRIYGQAGDDRLSGMGGADYLEGGAGTDTLYGGAGNDKLLGGKDADVLIGGADADEYRYRKGDGTDYVIDFAGDGFGGDGAGTISWMDANGGWLPLTGQKTLVDPINDAHSYEDGFGFRYVYTSVPGTGRRGILTITRSGEPGALAILGFNPGDLGITLAGASTIQKSTLTGTDDPDRLAADAPRQKILGLGGNDRIFLGTAEAEGWGGSGNDWITNDDGSQQFYGEAGRDILIASNGADELYGGDDEDVLQGGPDDDVLDGGSSDDFLDGGLGADVLYGGDGRDFLVGGGGMVPKSVPDAIDELLPAGVFVAAGMITGMQNMVGSLNLDADGANVIDGGAGEDTAIGGDGVDLILGGGGADALYGSAGADTLVGGDGADTLFGDAAEGELVFIRPGEPDLRYHVLPGYHANDVLIGGAGADTLVGDGGSDELYGGDDDDSLIGDSALLAAEYHRDDYLDGGDGNDKLWGNGGDDTLFGGDGDDTLQGDSSDVPPERKGRDYLDGGAGADWMVGDGGADILYGGTGDDFLFGDAENEPVSADGADLLDGEDGNDYLRGLGGDDVLFGGAGDDQLLGDGDGSRAGETGKDYLIGGTGNDLMDGGESDDTYELNVGDGIDKIFDQQGVNEVVFGPGIGAGSITVQQGDDGGGAFLVIGYGNGDLLAVENGFTGGIRFYRFSDGTVLTPEELSRRLPQNQYVPVAANPLDGTAISTGLSEVISGTLDDNTYFFDPGGGRDVVADPGGTDTVRFGPTVSAADLRFSRRSNGDLRVTTPGGEVRIEQHYLDPARRIERFELDDGTVIDAAALDALPIEAIEGSAGDDRLTGSDFDDTLAGSAGRDELSGGPGADTYVFAIDDGHDVIVDGDPAAGASDRLQLRGFARDDFLIERDVAGTLTLYSLISDDRITLPGFYLSAADQVEAFEFFADPVGTTPDETISLAEIEALPTVPVAGTPGDDLLAGSIADDTLYGAAGADTLTGLDGSDSLWGEDGDDLLDAGAGDDVLDGGGGNDILRGGPGGDVYLFGYGDGADAVEDTGDGADADALALFAGVGPADVELERLADDLVVTLRNALDRVTVRGQFAGDGVESLAFADGSFWDRIEIAARVPNRLTDGPDTFFGTAFADTIYGRGGDDVLSSLGGDDLVDGGDGRDTLYGGDGDDQLLGQAESDELRGGKGRDALLGGAGADVLYGEAGDDTLEGGPGDDVVTGGAGSDTYRVAPGDGRDAIYDVEASNEVDVLAFWASDPDDVEVRRVWDLFASTDTVYFDLLDGAGAPTGEWVSIAPFPTADDTNPVDRVTFANGTVWTAAELRARLTAGKPGADSLRGFFGAETIDGGAGDDVLAGNLGDDRLLGGEGRDLLYGESGADVLDGGAGDDSIYGDLTGGNASSPYGSSDILLGGDGRDWLSGDGGDDTLEGGPDADVLIGGAGSDLYLYNFGDGSDEIRDAWSPGSLGDVLRFGPGVLPGDLAFHRTEGPSVFNATIDLTVVIGGSATQLRITDFFAPAGAIESFEFDDGTRWVRADIDARLIAGTPDAQTGTAGDDTFVVDHERDTVTEQAGGGIDTILSGVPYTLPANVEHLTLTGVLNAAATGNTLDNVLRGNANDNVLNGDKGADTLIGGPGDDTYVDVDPQAVYNYPTGFLPDAVVEAPGEGFDTIDALAYDYALPDNVERLVLRTTGVVSLWNPVTRTYEPLWRYATGNALANVIDATAVNAANNIVLDGGPGADLLLGHAGSDVYVIDDTGDRIVEPAGATQGTDTIETSIDFALPAGIEALRLVGSAPIAGTGNDGANTLDGSRNDAPNALAGGRGDDAYVLGPGDTAVELDGEGFDRVTIAAGGAAVYRLADYANVEGLTLSDVVGMAALVGGAGDDALIGNAYANTLEGGAGSDTLAGGTGGDAYRTGRLLGARGAVARIDEDRILDAGTTGSAPDEVVVEALQGDLAAVAADGFDLVLRFARAHPADPAQDLLFESVRIAQFLASPAYEVERLGFGDGTALDLRSVVAGGIVATATAGAVIWGGAGADLLIASDGGQSLYGNGGDDDLRGGAGSDTLEGGAGNDRMLGGAGNDRYRFATGFGADAVRDAGGSDNALEFLNHRSTDVVSVVRDGARIALVFASGDRVVVEGAATGGGMERVAFADAVSWDAAGFEARASAGTINLAPFANGALRPVVALEDQPFALQLAGAPFADVDPGDALTLAARLAGGAPLPGWLAFDPQALAFAGTPGSGDVGTLAIELAATDAIGAMATRSFSLTVQNVNDAPIVLDAISRLTAHAGEALAYGFQPGTFGDEDPGDLLTYSATLADGTPLPGWLRVDGAGDWGQIVAEPGTGDLGEYVVALTATDAAGASATTAFTLQVLRLNHAPVVAAAIPDRSATEDGAFSFVFSAGTFSDPDAGDALAYGATRAGGGVLPAWLAFDPAARRFSGTPANGDVGAVSVTVTATDTAGASVADTFVLNVVNVNDAPLVLRAADTASVEEGQALSYLANAAFLDVDAGDALTYSAKLANGSALPSWLSINATTGKLSGTPAIGAIGTTDVRVTAQDRAGATATLPVLVTVLAAPPQNLVGTSSNNTLTGKSGDDRLDGKGGADTLRGGLGNDTYVVDNTGDSVVENANAGADLVEASIPYSISSRPYVEHVVLTGTAALNATGNGGNNMLRGNAANNTLSSNGGVDALQGLGGNDTLKDSGGNGLLDGGGGTDALTGNSGRQLFIGGTGNDTIATGSGADIIAFNKGDGQDTVNASSGADNVVSLGGGISYSELFLSKSGNNLVFETGGIDRITFKDWYASSTYRSVATLQVIAEAMAGYPSAGDPLLDAKVERFNFMALVQAFDAARLANANIARWQLMDKLLAAHLAASDSEALGGDLAYRYGLTGALAGVGFDAAAAVLSSSQFATAPQALQPAASLEQGPHRLA